MRRIPACRRPPAKFRRARRYWTRWDPAAPSSPPVIPNFYSPSFPNSPRHSRESGNPQPPAPIYSIHETAVARRESRAANPPCLLMGLQGWADAKLNGTIGCAAAPTSASSFPRLPPSFPRKRESRRLAIRNQVQTTASGSLLPSWEKARMRVSPCVSAALRARTPALPGAQICACYPTAVSAARLGRVVLDLAAVEARNLGRVDSTQTPFPILWIPAFAGSDGVKSGITAQ